MDGPERRAEGLSEGQGGPGLWVRGLSQGPVRVE